MIVVCYDRVVVCVVAIGMRVAMFVWVVLEQTSLRLAEFGGSVDDRHDHLSTN